MKFCSTKYTIKKVEKLPLSEVKILIFIPTQVQLNTIFFCFLGALALATNPFVL